MVQAGVQHALYLCKPRRRAHDNPDPGHNGQQQKLPDSGAVHHRHLSSRSIKNLLLQLAKWPANSHALCQWHTDESRKFPTRWTRTHPHLQRQFEWFTKHSDIRHNRPAEQPLRCLLEHHHIHLRSREFQTHPDLPCPSGWWGFCDGHTAVRQPPQSNLGARWSGQYTAVVV